MSSTTTYLTSAGRAIAERQRWDNRLREEMRFVVLDNQQSRWSTVVNKMARQIEDLPRWGVDFLMAADTDTYDSEETVDRLARTLSTATYNDHVLHRLADERIPYKMWLTRHDPEVRPAHAAVDGQKVALSTPFLVAGQHLQFPADSATASIDLWFGCRCVVLGRKR